VSDFLGNGAWVIAVLARRSGGREAQTMGCCGGKKEEKKDTTKKK